METTKKVTFTLNKETLIKLNELANKLSINKSGLINRLINEEINRLTNGKNM
jgi:hypothetical protein